jgi:hypothetical protein
MKKLSIVLAAVLWGMNFAQAFARAPARVLGKDDILIQASGGRHWIGHAQSDRSFITCYGTMITIEPGDKVMHGASCAAARAFLHQGVQRALNTYASSEGLGAVRLEDAYGIGKYALAKWTGEGGTKGKAVLLDDGEMWHVLTFGNFNEREARARGVPRDILGMLTAAK